ncbi:MAG: transcriptional repressor [Alphaproteobacteria bacterium]|nr:transcriptional repressor [Alphaproteobacteria bacterium]
MGRATSTTTTTSARSGPRAAAKAAALAKLRAAGLRPTRQRLALGALLFDGRHRHVTAEALHGEVQAQGAGVSLATVYNTLHQFTGAGLLREVVVAAGVSHFDTNVGDHHHLYFEEIGELRDIEAAQVRISGLPPAPKGAEVASIDVIVRLRRR